MKGQKFWKILIMSVAILVVTACGGAPDIEGDISEPEAVLEMSEAEVIVPTNTESPPEPTATPSPTDTPEPTSTPIPPPEPVFLEGTGDSIVNVDKPEVAMIARIAGNSCNRHFAVKSIDENNETIDLLVNTSDSHEGVVPIDFRNGEWTKRFEVSSNCEWSISLEPLNNASVFEAPGIFEGTGSDVILLKTQEGQVPDLAKIVGNSASRHFAVLGWSFESTDLLVNTSDPYEGTVLLDAETELFEIKAIGDWSIEVTIR